MLAPCRCRLRFVLVNQDVHVVVAHLVRLLQLVVEQLRVVNAEATVLATHPHHLVDHVEPVLGQLRTLVLLADNLANLLVLAVVYLELGLFLCPTQFTRSFLLQMLLQVFFCLQMPVVIFLHKVVSLVVLLTRKRRAAIRVGVLALQMRGNALRAHVLAARVDFRVLNCLVRGRAGIEFTSCRLELVLVHWFNFSVSFCIRLLALIAVEFLNDSPAAAFDPNF